MTQHKSPNSPELVEFVNHATEAEQRRDFVNAERLYKRVIQACPQHMAALFRLALLERGKGNLVAALALVDQAADVEPDNAELQLTRGNLLQETGDSNGAVSAYQRALTLKPGYLNALANLASLHGNRNEPQPAYELYKQALELAPQDPGLWNGFGLASTATRQLEVARDAFQRAIALDPQFPSPYVNLGALLMRLGELTNAVDQFRRTVDRFPNFARAHENYARAKRFSRADMDYIQNVEALVASVPNESQAQVILHFCLGKLYDDCEMFDNAFTHYTAGNTLIKQHVRYDPSAHQNWIDHTINTFGADFFSNIQDYGDSTQRPVFVIGMIRSGTTLIERIIDQHPLAVGAGERLDIPRVASRLTVAPHSKPMAPDRTLTRELAADYLQSLDAFDGQRVVDKSPTNFLHIGLIAAMFPHCHIVHCRRHPLDVCLSIYFQRFAHGHFYAYDLADIAHYYAEYERLMAHWRAVLPIDILEMNYEAIVSDTESSARRLIEYLELDWDPRCLEFHRGKGAVETASNWQVRQPIYERSVARWKHYAAALHQTGQSLMSAGVEIPDL